jgi:hypothetical protein
VDLPAFERWLRERDPAVLVAEERIVRRVVKRDREIAGLGLRVTHGRCLVVRRAALLACASAQDLGVDRELPERVILLARPSRTAEGDRAVLLARALFHARVHAALDDACDATTRDEGLTIDTIRKRVHAIGETEFDEIRSVLRQDDHLPRRTDAEPLEEERATYVEFAALWLELGRFDPALRAATFPGVRDDDAVERVVSEGLDVEAMFDASCPEELAPHRIAPAASSALRASGVRAPAAERVLAEVARDQRIDEAASARLRTEAAAARAKGNVVRAALLALEALHLAAPDDRASLLAEARDDVAELSRRLDAATRREPLAGADRGSASLTEPLLALAHMAARPALGGDLAVQLGLEARVLYDLQKAAIAAEREVLRVDVAAWAFSFGSRPVVRSLAPALEVRVAREVHAAEHKLALVHILPSGGAARDDAADLRALRRAVHALAADADASVRRAVGPKVQRVLEEVGLRPASRPEEVARTKLVEELVDLAITHGHFDLGQLRDAISRNDLKLPDLRGPHELVFDDPLLRADRRLAVELDGVYRRGEIYLRGLQKGSSLLFGTKVGRFVTLYAILPVLAAFILLEGLQHLLHPLLGLFGVHERHVPHLMGPVSFPLTALTIFGLLHSALFRKLAGKVAGAIGFFFAAIFFRLPMAIAQLPLVRRVLRSEPMAAFRRHVLRPVVLGTLAWLVLPGGHAHAHGFHASVHVDRIGGGTILLASFVLFLTKYGSAAEEMALDYAVRSFRHVRTRVLPGVLKAISEVFAAMVEGSERLIYAVDERLRFGRGEGSLRIVAKGALGLAWGFFAFWIRIYVNLLIEPQVNPIKHFPVVTVSHKIMLPMAPQVVHALIRVLRPIGRVAATTFASITALLLPGFFGFLAWELKENYKLYQASREGRLRAAPIGHHGETMAGLLKPGFHSGTIPKLTAKIRRAARAHAEKLAELQTQRLEIEEAIERFVARELTSLLARAPQWKGGPVEVAHVELGGNRVLVTLTAPRLAPAGAAGAAGAAGEHATSGAHAAGDACIAFEEQSGFIVAGLAQAGFVDALDDAQRSVFEAALAGLYARGAVDLVREQIESELARLSKNDVAPPYDIADDGLIVWPGGDYVSEIVYALDGDDVLPYVLRGAGGGDAGERRGEPRKPLRADRLMFARQTPTWRAWSDAWATDDAARSPLGADAPSLLPPRRVASIEADVDARSPASS